MDLKPEGIDFRWYLKVGVCDPGGGALTLDNVTDLKSEGIDFRWYLKVGVCDPGGGHSHWTM